MKKVNLKIQQLTEKSFAPFGRVINPFKNGVTKSGQNWECFSPVDFMQPTTTMGVGIVDTSVYPKRISTLERHVSREELLWTTTKDLVLLVASSMLLGDPNEKPRVEAARAFEIKAGQAIIIKNGTWHAPAFTISGNSRYYFMIEIKPDLIDQDKQPWIPFENDEVIELIEQ